MSDLRYFIWNNKNSSSVINRYKKLSIKLNQWPDFGFVDCPSEYIRLSAILTKTAMEYEKIKYYTYLDQESVNHFLYVCKMLGIASFTNIKPSSHIKLKNSALIVLLKGLFNGSKQKA